MHQADPLSTARFANPNAVLIDCLQFFAPPTRVSTPDYAVQKRKLQNDGGGYTGDWSHAKAPYLIGPMAALDMRDYLTVALVKPGQCGGTEVAQNWLLKSIGADPANMLWYMQTEKALQAFVKERIDGPAGMIALHEIMRDRLGKMPSDNSLGMKRFANMIVQFLEASPANLINKSGPRIVADEIDAYSPKLGDVKAMLDVRRQTFGRDSKLFCLSHPDAASGMSDRKWSRGIMAVYADSTRCLWYWPCPFCRGYSSPNPTAARYMPIEYPVDGTLDEVEAEARLVCPHCQQAIEDGYRRGMNAAGKWVGLGQEIDEDGTVAGELIQRDTAGFWIVGAMSPFVLGGIGGLARARAKAAREAEDSGEDKTLRQVVVKQWGLPYEPVRRAGSIDADALAGRAEPIPLGVVPEGVRFLTTAIDVQADRFEGLTRGWGVNGESWVVDIWSKLAEPATNPDDWDALLQDATSRAYPLADGSGRVMRVRAVGYDSGGAPGVTEQAYQAWMRLKQARKARHIGTIAQRRAWCVLALKGMSGLNAARLMVRELEATRKDRTAAGTGIPLGQFNPNMFKAALAGQLARADAGPWRVHFPSELCADAPPHRWFEQLVAEREDHAGRWHKIASNARNEALDLMVMAHVMAHLFGVNRINWQSPPAWAAEWDDNALVAEAPEDSALADASEGAAPGPAPSAVAPAPAALPVQAAEPILVPSQSAPPAAPAERPGKADRRAARQARIDRLASINRSV